MIHSVFPSISNQRNLTHQPFNEGAKSVATKIANFIGLILLSISSLFILPLDIALLSIAGLFTFLNPLQSDGAAPQAEVDRRQAPRVPFHRHVRVGGG
jgi:hypothetical protein